MIFCLSVSLSLSHSVSLSPHPHRSAQITGQRIAVQTKVMVSCSFRQRCLGQRCCFAWQIDEAAGLYYSLFGAHITNSIASMQIGQILTLAEVRAQSLKWQ